MKLHRRFLSAALLFSASLLGGCYVTNPGGYYYPTATYDASYGYVASPMAGRVYYGGGYYSGVYYRPGYYAPTAPFISVQAAPPAYYGQPVYGGAVATPAPVYGGGGYVRPGPVYGGGAVATPAPSYGGGYVAPAYGGGVVATPAPARPPQMYVAPAAPAAPAGPTYMAPAVGGGVQVAPRVGVPIAR